MTTSFISIFFFFNDTATTEIYTLSLHDALPIWELRKRVDLVDRAIGGRGAGAEAVDQRHDDQPGHGRGNHLHARRSEEHTSELQSRLHLVCRLLLEKKKTNKTVNAT